MTPRRPPIAARDPRRRGARRGRRADRTRWRKAKAGALPRPSVSPLRRSERGDVSRQGEPRGPPPSKSPEPSPHVASPRRRRDPVRSRRARSGAPIRDGSQRLVFPRLDRPPRSSDGARPRAGRRPRSGAALLEPHPPLHMTSRRVDHGTSTAQPALQAARSSLRVDARGRLPVHLRESALGGPPRDPPAAIPSTGDARCPEHRARDRPAPSLRSGSARLREAPDQGECPKARPSSLRSRATVKAFVQWFVLLREIKETNH